MANVSIIIPIYNAEKYLEACIKSIVNEMSTGDELLLVDDGSKDSSSEICKRFMSNSVKYYYHSNHGVSYTRNAGIEFAEKDYALFVDADDYLLQGWRTEIAKAMSGKQDVIAFSERKKDSYTKKEILDSLICFPTRSSNIVHPAVWWKIYKAAFLRDNEIRFDCNLINGEDGIFNIEALIKANTYCVYHSKPFYYYRPNEVSATHIFNQRFNDSNIIYAVRVKKLLDESNEFTSEELNGRMGYITIQGIYLLVYRISMIEDKTLRREKFDLFRNEYYIRAYQERYLKTKCELIRKIVFGLVRNGWYQLAIQIVLLRGYTRSLIKKVGYYGKNK